VAGALFLVWRPRMMVLQWREGQRGLKSGAATVNQSEAVQMGNGFSEGDRLFFSGVGLVMTELGFS